MRQNLYDDWIGGAEEPLGGFSWRGGAQRDTTGLVFWTDVFFHGGKYDTNKMAILLVDTQGRIYW